ncbi:transaldolase [Maribacter sp. 2210JD10-5]|uniref:transaldolase n=1 Tax=Maribacter sp. 2210JD10-5 TaxID=3386272 RepID=UPI0039BD8814
MNKILPFVLLIIFTGCSPSSEKTDTIYFAGEIVNPTSENVLLFKGNKVVDSAQLDGNNRFSFKLDNLENGLYHFNHAPEYQYVYLEKGDSLLLRLNTSDFDESLVFSGTNEEINNFLLELFLANEEEELDMYRTYYNLEAEAFSDQINLLRISKLKDLDNLKLESDFSEEAYNMAKASINYTYYRYSEVYPFEHKRKLRETVLHELPKDFYGYRKNISYDNKSLNYLRPYYDFMKSHLGNLSYMTCSENCGIKGKVVKNQLHFNQHKLQVIDSLVVEKELRDNLFRNVAFNYLLKEHDAPENNKMFIENFQKVSENNMHIEEIENLYNGIRNIQPKKPLPNVKVISLDGQNLSLAEIAKNKNVIFYFWSATDKNHYKNIFKRAAELQSGKTDYELIGINIRTEPKNWKGLVQTYGLDPNKQFRATNFEELSEKLVLYPMNKCIIAKDTLIVDAFSNIYDTL